eukprot:scpid49212/ scgid21408/ Calcium release-activated calcium channel protein 1; Protein orai-1; Transmembrane protein 142A
MADVDDAGAHSHLGVTDTAARKRGIGHTSKVQEEWNDLLLSRAKLKQSSNTSALLSGFAMVAFVEIELGDVEVQPWLLVLFSLVTTTLVGTHLFALMISTCILPRIATTMAHKPSAESLSRSPHRHIQNYIEMSWIFSTWIGIILFLVDAVLIAWVKFAPLETGKKRITGLVVGEPLIRPAGSGNTSSRNSSYVDLTAETEHKNANPYFYAAIAATIVLVLFMAFFMLFAYQFYKYMIKHRFHLAKTNLEEMRQTMAELQAQDELDGLRDHDTFSRYSGDWHRTPGSFSHSSINRYHASHDTGLAVGIHGTPVGGRQALGRDRAGSAASLSSYNPYRQTAASYGTHAHTHRSTSPAAPTVHTQAGFSQQSDAMYLSPKATPSLLMPPPSPHYAKQQVSLLQMDQSPLHGGRRGIPSHQPPLEPSPEVSAAVEAAQAAADSAVHSVCIREGADINSDHSATSHESHPHMFMTAAEYAQLTSSRPHNPTVWQDPSAAAQAEIAANRQSAHMMSPHAALRYTVPASFDNQMSVVSDLSARRNEDDQASNATDASYSTATGTATAVSPGSLTDTKSHVADWVHRQAKHNRKTKDQSNPSSPPRGRGMSPPDSMESAM